MLFGRILISFILQHLKSSDELGPCEFRFDNLIDIAFFAGNIRICELPPELLNLCRSLFCASLFIQLMLEDDLNCSFRPHHGDLSCRVGKIDIRTDMLSGHDAVGSAVGLACDNGDFRHCGLGKRIQEFCPVTDYSTMFLRNTWQKSGHILKSDKWDIKGIAKANESSSFSRGIYI